MAISPQRFTIYLYSAHRAVIFAIAQLSCLILQETRLVAQNPSIVHFGYLHAWALCYHYQLLFMTSPTVERYDWLAILCLLFTVYGVVYVRFLTVKWKTLNLYLRLLFIAKGHESKCAERMRLNCRGV